MDPFTVPLTVGRMGRAASQLRPLALVFGEGVEGMDGAGSESPAGGLRGHFPW